jgi:tRNA dimethylallyltransferase
MKSPHEKRVIILLGPTGVGKTGASILLAKALGAEIISADSMQIYRHMDIGTAKPSQDQLREVPHHLIDILSPNESFSAGLFNREAVKIIDDLHDRDKVPLVVGGTGLYIRTLTGGLFKGPSADRVLREKLKDEEARKGKGYLYKYLQQVDPEAAIKIEPNDLRRTIRALEVAIIEEKTISDFQHSSTETLSYNFIKIGLARERKELYELIEKRVDRMIGEGLISETEKLMEMKPDRTPLQALGYKEMKRYLDGEITIDEAVNLLKKRTRNYAKRQLTWFRKEPDVNWVDVTGIMDAESVFKKVVNSIDALSKNHD